jgi:ABC-type phosphate transport system ATPase subunit
MKLQLTVLFFSFLILFAIESSSQGKIIYSGIVTSMRVPLNKVKIQALNSGESAVTDSLGRFKLNGFKKDILEVSASGFEQKRVKVGRQTTLAISLLFRNDPENVNDAVSNGHISEEALSEAISQTQTKKGKDYSTYQSIYELMGSEIYNVTVEGNVIYNKKNVSLTSEPRVLCVVDGKVVRDISFIVPSNVKSIEFIDDVGASLWGVQGANGVLSITLK